MIRKRRILTLLLLGALPGCRSRTTPQPGDTTPPGQMLAEARRGFHTHVLDRPRAHEPPPAPPPALFSLVHYPSPAGSLAAYVTPRPADGGRRPAIVWIQGGFDSSINESAWTPGPAQNDQSARAFREAGAVLMMPSLRGGNDNPGQRETAYGEVDDVIAAGDYLAKLDYVDPARVFLGGHSTGGTLALLVAESTDRFRAVFSFGPVGKIESYGDELTFDRTNATELRLRSPAAFLSAIRTPTFVFEGALRPSNAAALPSLTPKDGGPPVHIFRVAGFDHFSVLSPVTTMLAHKIVEGPGTVDVSEGELAPDRLATAAGDGAARSAFWRWFTAHADAVATVHRADEPIANELGRELHRVDPGLTFEVGASPAVHELVVSADGIKSVFPAVKGLVAAAPVIPGWKITAFRPRGSADVSVDLGNGRRLAGKELTFRVVGARPGEIDVVLYVKGASAVADATKQPVYLLLDAALGEYDVETYLGAIDIEPGVTAPADARPLGELPKAVDAVK